MTSLRGSRLGWYARRLGRMSLAELAWRARDRALQSAWSFRRAAHERASADGPAPPGRRRFSAVLPAGAGQAVPEHARLGVLAAAEQLLGGEWEFHGVTRTDLASPDWFRDPVTGRRAPADRYAFRINHRSQAQTGNVKQVWELSRLQHLTLLATAWFLSHDDRYADRVADQLRSWWRENPFLTGVNWTSGIEVGLRLISMTWIRRLLNDWPGVAGLFDDSELALRQIRRHQQYLAALRSRGSSANNHVIAEAAGQLIASCAFPWFARSRTWRIRSKKLLERELLRNTFPSGVNRELASDYHCFAAELSLLAAVESEAAGHSLDPAAWRRLVAMVDSGAALLDERMRPPRQGDGDEGRVLLLDPPAANRWPSMLAVGQQVFGRLDWWPLTTPDASSSIIGSMATAALVVDGRPSSRPWRFTDAGMTVLRTPGGKDPEIWCRCDGGPHGYLSIAAHAHADALSVEIRYGGVDVLADPGTYCYHGEAAWRSYFRSTIAHNTVEIDGRDQSVSGGPFLWLRHVNAREIDVADIGDAVEWTAEHDGYRGGLGSRFGGARPAGHRRCVRLDRASRSIDIVDEITGGTHAVRMAFHFGPEVEVELAGGHAVLRWPGAGTPGAARLELARPLRWRLHRGESEPILGWYSSGLGRRTPSATLVGQGDSDPRRPLTTRLQFFDVRTAASTAVQDPAISWTRSDAVARYMPDIQAEAG